MFRHPVAERILFLMASPLKHKKYRNELLVEPAGFCCDYVKLIQYTFTYLAVEAFVELKKYHPF